MKENNKEDKPLKQKKGKIDALFSDPNEVERIKEEIDNENNPLESLGEKEEEKKTGLEIVNRIQPKIFGSLAKGTYKDTGLSEKRKELILNTILQMKVDGYSYTEIIEEIRKDYSISEFSINIYYDEVIELLKKDANEISDSVLSLHIERYNKLYKWFKKNKFSRGVLKALFYKEKVMGMHAEIQELNINNIILNPENQGIILNWDNVSDTDKSLLPNLFRKLFKRKIDENGEITGSDPFDKILEQSVEKQLFIELYKRSYYEFFKKAYSILLPGEPYSDNWHIEYLCGELQQEVERIIRREVRKQDMIINMPFRSSKSLITTVVFPVWCWTINQSLKFITVSYSASLALEHTKMSKNLMQSEWFQGLYGELVQFLPGEDKIEFYKIKGGGSRKAVGSGGAITGSGADLIICLSGNCKILTDIGEIEIQNIVDNKLIIKVASYNHKNSIIEYKSIKRYDKNPGKKLIKIITESKYELICTEDHEVWTENRGYIKACELSETDRLFINFNEQRKLKKIKSIEYLEDIPDYVYNIEVEDNHNYFVNGILTHNCDDPQNPKLAASEKERKNIIDFYSGSLYSRLNQLELGVRIVVMQRLNEADLSGHLLETAPEDHKHICIPVEVDLNKLKEENLSPKNLIKHYKDGLFWADRFTRTVIKNFIKRLGSVQAAGQLYQRPAPKEGNMVKRDWFDIIEASTVERDIAYHPMMFYIDTAESSEQKEAGDSTAIVVCYKKDNCVYVCNVIKLKKEFYELVKFIPEFVNANMYSQYSQIKIEPKSSGKSVVSQLRASTMLNVQELKSPKDDKVTRMASITPLCESRRVKFINGNYLTSFLDNLLVFPNGAHDDDVDAFIHAIEDLLVESDFDFAFL